MALNPRLSLLLSALLAACGNSSAPEIMFRVPEEFVNTELDGISLPIPGLDGARSSVHVQFEAGFLAKEIPGYTQMDGERLLNIYGLLMSEPLSKGNPNKENGLSPCRIGYTCRAHDGYCAYWPGETQSPVLMYIVSSCDGVIGKDIDWIGNAVVSICPKCEEGETIDIRANARGRGYILSYQFNIANVSHHKELRDLIQRKAESWVWTSGLQ